MASVAQLVPALVTAIGPAILVSAVGMLLLTLTNRLGRVIDRSRALAALVSHDAPHAPRTARAQLDVLWKRARLIRLSIALASTSALIAALLVAVLFVTALFRLEIAWLVALLFVACLGTLVSALAVFLRDINLNLVALEMETAEARGSTDSSDSRPAGANLPN
jgi:hypothetical protein